MIVSTFFLCEEVELGVWNLIRFLLISWIALIWEPSWNFLFPAIHMVSKACTAGRFLTGSLQPSTHQHGIRDAHPAIYPSVGE
jgi:hypothetical protein